MDRDNGLTSGKKLYFELIDQAYKTVELPDSQMRKYIVHLAHTTQALNPNEFALRTRTVRKCNRLVTEIISSDTVQNILADDSLDE